MWRSATSKIARLQNRLVPLFSWVPLIDDDWQQAARFWAEARRKGRQFGDPDLLLAALAHRLGGIVVSNDGDFDALPVDVALVCRHALIPHW